MTDKDTLLENLYNKLCENLLEKLESGEATAQDMNVARQFLKDNSVSAVASYGSPLGQIAEALPFDDQAEEGQSTKKEVNA